MGFTSGDHVNNGRRSDFGESATGGTLDWFTEIATTQVKLPNQASQQELLLSHCGNGSKYIACLHVCGMSSANIQERRVPYSRGSLLHMLLDYNPYHTFKQQSRVYQGWHRGSSPKEKLSFRYSFENLCIKAQIPPKHHFDLNTSAKSAVQLAGPLT